MLPATMSPVLMPMPMSSVGMPVGGPLRVQARQLLDHRQRRLHRVVGVVGIVERRAEQRHDHVADELVDRALVREHDRHHAREVLVQLRDDVFGLAALGHAS